MANMAEQIWNLSPLQGIKPINLPGIATVPKEQLQQCVTRLLKGYRAIHEEL